MIAMLIFGVAQYAAWLALVGQATADVERAQYGVASGVFKTSTHVGGAIAVAVAATIIDAMGGGDSRGAARTPRRTSPSRFLSSWAPPRSRC